MSKRPATMADYRDAALAMIRQYGPRVDNARQLLADLAGIDGHASGARVDEFAAAHPIVKVKADGTRRLARNWQPIPRPDTQPF